MVGPGEGSLEGCHGSSSCLSFSLDLLSLLLLSLYMYECLCVCLQSGEGRVFGLMWSSVYVCVPRRGSVHKNSTVISFPLLPKKHMWLAEDLTSSAEEIKEWVGLTFLCWFPLFLVPIPIPLTVFPAPILVIKAEVHKLLAARKLQVLNFEV